MALPIKTYRVLKTYPNGASLTKGDLVKTHDYPARTYLAISSNTTHAFVTNWYIDNHFLEEIRLSQLEKLIYNIRD